jgi:hypothetical protein
MGDVGEIYEKNFKQISLTGVGAKLDELVNHADRLGHCGCSGLLIVGTR